jgi:hypothetical protein
VPVISGEAVDVAAFDVDLESVDLGSGSSGANKPAALCSSPYSNQNVIEIKDRHGRARGRVAFEFPQRESPLTTDQRIAFRDDFCRELARLEDWADQCDWVPAAVSRFDVIVSDRFRISRSLVPGWMGFGGQMEFPVWRVADRTAAIMHELVHVLFPNGNRLLAEGFAIHLQDAIGSNPAFPNFGKPLHETARDKLRGFAPAASLEDTLARFTLGDLDAIATPSPLTLLVGDTAFGEEPRGQGFIYPVAGSFVRFLLDTGGLADFQRVYALTPLVPGAHNAGARARWGNVYGSTFHELEGDWKAMISNRAV